MAFSHAFLLDPQDGAAEIPSFRSLHALGYGAWVGLPPHRILQAFAPPSVLDSCRSTANFQSGGRLASGTNAVGNNSGSGGGGRQDTLPPAAPKLARSETLAMREDAWDRALRRADEVLIRASSARGSLGIERERIRQLCSDLTNKVGVACFDCPLMIKLVSDHLAHLVNDATDELEPIDEFGARGKVQEKVYRELRNAGVVLRQRNNELVRSFGSDVGAGSSNGALVRVFSGPKINKNRAGALVALLLMFSCSCMSGNFNIFCADMLTSWTSYPRRE